MNTHGLPNDLPQVEYDTLKKGKLANYGRSAEELKNPEKTYFVYVLLRNMQAIRYAMTLPQWNGTSITANGGSQGGYQSFVIAALASIAPDMPITSISAKLPWACDLGAKEPTRHGSSFGCSLDNPGAAYLDTANFAALINPNVKAYVECGFADPQCPPTGITAAYNMLKCEKEIVYHQARGHLTDVNELNFIVAWTRKN
jgi:cephalosporin-C deacetylase-like acetyl esterase